MAVTSPTIAMATRCVSMVGNVCQSGMAWRVTVQIHTILEKLVISVSYVIYSVCTIVNILTLDNKYWMLYNI